MRLTARRKLASLGFLIAVSGFSAPGWAADAGVITPTITSPTATASQILPPATPTTISSPDAKTDKGLDSVQTKIPDSVKEVIKRLDNANTITLEDLNSARQAVARIDALIDIEKHIAELEKIREDREGSSKSSKSLAAAIPASAIAPPPFMPPFPSASRNEPAAMPIVSMAPPEVTRISGSNGRYFAILKTSDGQSKNVSVGDHLLTGGTVEKITASEVVIDQNGTQRILHVKNVDMVFSNTP